MKMVKTVIADDSILPYLVQLSKSNEYKLGLILGQTAGQRDYVIHLAQTPPLVSKEGKRDCTISSPDLGKADVYSCLTSLKDVKDNWVADHAKHVTRMLPGGMWVLGIFIVGPGDAFSDLETVARIRSILACMKKYLSLNPFLHGDSPNYQKLTLHYSMTTQKFMCKAVDEKSMTPVDWKFQPKATRWHQLECFYNVDQMFPIEEDVASASLKKHVQMLLSGISENVDRAVCMLDGQLRDEDETLEMLDKKKKGFKASGKGEGEESRIIPVNFYIPCNTEEDDEVQTFMCCAEMNIVGLLASRVFVHQRATVKDAVQAVKQDIVRSLASRLEMHWDSLVEEEQGSPEERLILHEPPRRVLVPLPSCRVTLSDYLFPGEGPSEALVSLQELLDLNLTEEDVEKDVELQADPAEFCNMEPPLESTSSTNNVAMPAEGRQTSMLFSGLLASFLVMAASILLQFYWRQ